VESTLWLPQETAARDKTMILSCRNANNMLLQVKIQMTFLPHQQFLTFECRGRSPVKVPKFPLWGAMCDKTMM
jgi:hypothetical protein